MQGNRIARNFDGKPTIFNGSFSDGTIVENSIIGGGFGTLIIDQEFIDDILSIIDVDNLGDNFIINLTYIYNQVYNYFYSSKKNDLTREQFYDQNYICDEGGQIIGTKISSLKGQNVALCSEKSVATYIILSELYKKGLFDRQPTLVLSEMQIEDYQKEPHAFLLLDQENNKYPIKHTLYDAENPSLIENANNEQKVFIGLYSLTDEERENVANGIEFRPASTFNLINPNYHEVGYKRKYGSITHDIKL